MKSGSKTSSSADNAEASSESSSSSGSGTGSSTSEDAKSSTEESSLDYHMRTARVSSKCNDIIFADQSTSECKNDDTFANILSSAVVKKEAESEMSWALTAPIKQRLLFPGLARALKERDEQRKVNRHRKELTLIAQSVQKAANFTQIHFKDFATEPLEFKPIKGRRHYISDTGLYDSYAHVLAFSAAKNIAYFENPDPGLDEGLPVQIDASDDVRLLKGEFAKRQAIINPELLVTAGNTTAAANKHKIKSHLESFKLKKPDFTVTEAGFVEADISVGIAGCRLFERHVEEELEWPLKERREYCERKREYCARKTLLAADSHPRVRRNIDKSYRRKSGTRSTVQRVWETPEPSPSQYHNTRNSGYRLSRSRVSMAWNE